MTVTYTSESIVIRFRKFRQTFWWQRLKWRGGCYGFMIDPIFTWPIVLPSDIENWLKENTKAEVLDRNQSLTLDFIIQFRTMDEATAFKLRWT